MHVSYTQRCFGPWLDFGHFELSPFVYDYFFKPNSFAGDNRGFSLLDTKRYNGQYPSGSSIYGCPDSGIAEAVSARTHQKTTFTLGMSTTDCQESFSSGTCGAFLFGATSGNHCTYDCRSESDVYGDSWFNQNNLYLHTQASNGCVPLSADIDLRSKLSFAIEQSAGGYISYLRVRGMIFHKEFPAQEYFLSDNFGNKVFVHAFSPENESVLFKELIINLYDGFYPFDYRISINPITGEFGREIIYSTLRPNVEFESIQFITPGGFIVDEGPNSCLAYVSANRSIEFQYTLSSIASWNNSFTSLAPAGDCLSIPCTGILGTCDTYDTCE